MQYSYGMMLATTAASSLPFFFTGLFFTVKAFWEFRIRVELTDIKNNSLWNGLHAL